MQTAATKPAARLRVTLANLDGLTHVQRFPDRDALDAFTARTGLKVVQVEEIEPDPITPPPAMVPMPAQLQQARAGKSKVADSAAPQITGPKYEFTGELKVHFGITLRRIRCVTAFGVIAAGTLGGWIEREENLSQVYGNAWVSGNARVYGNARVSGDAQVSGNARVYGNARVSGDAQVYGNARVARRITCAGRSDGYVFTLATDHVTGNPVIIAGCRYFDFEAARRHWTKTRGGTPLGDETFAILDMLERISAVRGPEPAPPADVEVVATAEAA